MTYFNEPGENVIFNPALPEGRLPLLPLDSRGLVSLQWSLALSGYAFAGGLLWVLFPSDMN